MMMMMMMMMILSNRDSVSSHLDTLPSSSKHSFACPVFNSLLRF